MSRIAKDAPSELLTHLSPAQLDFFRLRAAEDLRHGRPPTLRFRNGVQLIDALRTFATDRSEDVQGSLSLGLQHVATKSEVSRSIAGRLKLDFDKPPPSFDEAIEQERAAIEARRRAA